MSLGTLSARIHKLTPPDELIGSLTRERVGLLVRYAGCHLAAENGTYAAKRWLAYVLDIHVPMDPFMAVALLADEAQTVETCDLEHWFDVPNTEANREAMQDAADGTLTLNIEALTNTLCAQLGVTA